jgi:hypothetical protein
MIDLIQNAVYTHDVKTLAKPTVEIPGNRVHTESDVCSVDAEAES